MGDWTEDDLAAHELSQLSTDDTVTVPRALLSLCADLLEECDKHIPITGSNFDHDMDLARAQLREHLK